MRRGLLVWLLIMAVETVHGVLRGLLLVPHLGEVKATQLGWWVGAVLVLTIAGLTIRWIGLTRRSELLQLGAAWASLTVLFELLIGRLRGFDGTALMRALDPDHGSIAWSAALMLAAPLLAAWIRGRS